MTSYEHAQASCYIPFHGIEKNSKNQWRYKLVQITL